jgi:hypothetical protein
VFDKLLSELMEYYINGDEKYSAMLEGAYLYKARENVFNLILVYNGWDEVLDMDSKKGVCHDNFYDAIGIYLVSYAMKLTDLDFDESSAFVHKNSVKVLYDKNGIFNSFVSNKSKKRQFITIKSGGYNGK